MLANINRKQTTSSYPSDGYYLALLLLWPLVIVYRWCQFSKVYTLKFVSTCRSVYLKQRTTYDKFVLFEGMKTPYRQASLSATVSLNFFLNTVVLQNDHFSFFVIRQRLKISMALFIFFLKKGLHVSLQSIDFIIVWKNVYF